MIHYARQYAAQSGQRISEISDPPATDYGKAYQQLIQLAATNHLRLVLANYSMAVNSLSDSDTVEFYRVGYPGIASQIVANAAHTKLVRQLAQQHPDICFVDTQPGIDGNHSLFIDAVHFTQAGRQQLAETFFAGIQRLVEEDCVRTNQPR